MERPIPLEAPVMKTCLFVGEEGVVGGDEGIGVVVDGGDEVGAGWGGHCGWWEGGGWVWIRFEVR